MVGLFRQIITWCKVKNINPNADVWSGGLRQNLQKAECRKHVDTLKKTVLYRLSLTFFYTISI